MGQKIWGRWRHGPRTAIFQNSGGGGGAGGCRIQGPSQAAPRGCTTHRNRSRPSCLTRSNHLPNRSRHPALACPLPLHPWFVLGHRKGLAQKLGLSSCRGGADRLHGRVDGVIVLQLCRVGGGGRRRQMTGGNYWAESRVNMARAQKSGPRSRSALHSAVGPAPAGTSDPLS